MHFVIVALQKRKIKIYLLGGVYYRNFFELINVHKVITNQYLGLSSSKELLFKNSNMGGLLDISLKLEVGAYFTVNLVRKRRKFFRDRDGICI